MGWGLAFVDGFLMEFWEEDGEEIGRRGIRERRW